MKTAYFQEQYGQHPGLTWMINYDAGRALANYYFLAARMNDGRSLPWPRVFASRDCAAIVITNGTIDAVRDPHVAAWRESFFELDKEEFLRRVEDCLAGTRRYLGASMPEKAA